jgi:hypothetical protein
MHLRACRGDRLPGLRGTFAVLEPLQQRFRQTAYRIDRWFFASELRFRTKIALPITALELNLLMNQ